MPFKSPIWELYISNKTLYKTDQSHFNAWCKNCLPSTASQSRRRHTQIRLADLFDYQKVNNYLDFYQTTVKQNLQTQAENFEQMFTEQ